jgi:Pleiotropic transcriptional repressor
MSLLEKLREMQNLLKKEKLAVADLVTTISNTIACNTYLINSEGNILGYALPNGDDCTQFDKSATPALKLEFKQRVSFVFQTVANLPLETCFLRDDNCYAANTFMTIVPIRSMSSTFGHLLMTKKNQQFSEEDLILAETASLLSSICLAQKVTDSAPNFRHQGDIDMVLESLSFSEIKALNSVFAELNGLEGFLVASKIADRIGISRSVIVNAMRKLESAGIVNSRSLGIKGTYIKIKNSSFLDALKARVR